jgi:hypothetical protein
MSKRFKDTNGAGASVINKSDRMKLIGHLQDASASVPDASHVIHGHLLKAANVIGAIEDRSGDASSAPGNLTSPGTISNLSNRPGTATHLEGASIAERAFGSAMDLFKAGRETFEARRKMTVVALYKAAANEGNKEKKATFEQFANELGNIEIRDLEKRAGSDVSKVVIGSQRKRQGWAERHGF